LRRVLGFKYIRFEFARSLHTSAATTSHGTVGARAGQGAVPLAEAPAFLLLVVFLVLLLSFAFPPDAPL